MYLWRELGISSWPTFAIVSPNGKLIAQISGEGRRKVLMLILLIYFNMPVITIIARIATTACAHLLSKSHNC